MKSSQEYPVEAGVSQGSIFGPAFFLLYIDHLPDDIVCNIAFYADDTKKKKKKKIMAPFYGWASTASRLQPLPGGSLLFTIQFPEIPGTNFIDLRRMKG